MPDDTTCQWFLRCEREATGTTPHPILGDVPSCDTCHAFATGEPWTARNASARAADDRRSAMTDSDAREVVWRNLRRTITQLPTPADYPRANDGR